MTADAKPLEWRAHRRQMLLKPRRVSLASGAVSARATGGTVAAGEWSLLAAGEQVVMAKGSSASVLERFADDGLTWRGRVVDFHEAGVLTGPLAFRSDHYTRPSIPLIDVISAIAGASLAAGAMYLLPQHGVEFGKEVIAMWFIAASGLGCLQVLRFAAMFRSYRENWKSREEALAFPADLDEAVGYRRFEVMANVIEEGVEAAPEGESREVA